MKHIAFTLYLTLLATTAHGMCGPEAPNIPFTYLCSVLSAFAQNSAIEREKAGDILPNVVEASQLVPTYPIKPLAECTTPEECFCMYYPETQYWQNLIQYLKTHADTVIKYDDAASIILTPYCVQVQFAELVTIITQHHHMPCRGMQNVLLVTMRRETQENIERCYPELRNEDALSAALMQIQRILSNMQNVSQYEASTIKAFGETITSQLKREQERIVQTLSVAQQLIGTQVLERSFSETRALLNTLANANASASSAT